MVVPAVSGSSKYTVMNVGRSATGRSSHASTWSTRSLPWTPSSYAFQNRGCIPWIGASDPTQNIDAAACIARWMLTQIGSPPHHIGSLTSSRFAIDSRRSVFGSLMVLATMP